MRDDLQALLRREPVVLVRQYPALRQAMERALTRREVVALLPGAYTLPAHATNLMVRVLAACLTSPDAVVLDTAAARLGYDGDRSRVDVITVAGRHRGRPTGYRFERRAIPVEWVQMRRGLRFTHPAWTALDLCGAEGPRAIDEALRLGVPLDAMEAALADRGRRRGNAALRAWLAESRERPFSFAERAAHTALREGDVTGWRGNVRLRLPGRDVVLDIAFERERLAVEVDGYTFHSSTKAFTQDRLRDADLMAAGWVVLRLPATLVIDEPERFVHLVRRALAQRGRQP